MMSRAGLILLLLLMLPGCCNHLLVMSRPANFPILLPNPSLVRGVVVLAPGLNLRPEALNSLANEFIRHGFAAVIVNLESNSKQTNEPNSEYHQRWRAAFADVVKNARSDYLQQPIIFFGFSLGGLLALDYLLESSDQETILLLAAPPLALNLAPAALISLAQILPGFTPIPSVSPVSYRLRSHLTAAHYQSLQVIRNHVLKLLFTGTRPSIPIHVILSSTDELVSSDRTAKLFDAWSPEVKIFVVNEPSSGWGHLLIDRISIGTSAWHWLFEQLPTSR